MAQLLYNAYYQQQSCLRRKTASESTVAPLSRARMYFKPHILPTFCFCSHISINEQSLQCRAVGAYKYRMLPTMLLKKGASCP